MKPFTIAGAFGLVAATALAGAGRPALASEAISADAIAHELRDLGLTASTDQDPSGNPRIKTAVDRHDWVIVLRDCAEGALEQRACQGFQFIVDTEVAHPVSSELVNKWNKEYRYARASLRQGERPGCAEPGACTARVATDVLIAGTNGDAAKTFRGYFEIVKRRSASFRKYIGAPE